jgi:hypothetical protein
MARGPLYIFLDLNHWIYLSREYHGKPHHKGHRGIASALLEKVHNDEVRMPVGMVHFIEHLQNENSARRERLAIVFELYSHGWCFASWSDIFVFELRQALQHMFEGLTPALPTVFKRGFMSTTSAKGREILLNEQTSEFLAFTTALSAQPGALFNMLTTTTDANRKEQKTSNARVSSENAKAFEDLRMRRRQCSREEYRHIQHVQYIFDHENLLLQELAALHRSIQDFVALGKDGLSRFWSNVPSINVDCELTAYRDRQWSRKVQPNDVKDLEQLAIAVPYCDAVVVENFWKRAITETGLGEKYRTAVFCDLAELLPYIESEQQAKVVNDSSQQNSAP